MIEFVDKMVGYEALQSKFKLVDSRPFDSNSKYMSSTCLTQGGTH